MTQYEHSFVAYNKSVPDDNYIIIGGVGLSAKRHFVVFAIAVVPHEDLISQIIVSGRAPIYPRTVRIRIMHETAVIVRRGFNRLNFGQRPQGLVLLWFQSFYEFRYEKGKEHIEAVIGREICFSKRDGHLGCIVTDEFLKSLPDGIFGEGVSNLYLVT